MTDAIVFTYHWLRFQLSRVVPDERGEGVISTAIAILIMAALGAIMWIGIQQLWGDTSSQTSDQIAKIGN